jgi:HK97 family phage prohead protease
MITRAEAAELRSLRARDTYARPSQRRHAEWVEGTSGPRVARRFDVRKAASGVRVASYASVTDTPYEMWDMFGPYTEVVELDAFGATLAAGPMVEFTLNHGAGGGLPMAHTRNGTLTLEAIKDGEETGLWYDASVDDSRTDVSDAAKAMERGDLAESSFKFRIVRGQWSPDWMEYHIKEVDLDRGDVSAVNFGANPYTANPAMLQKHADSVDDTRTAPVPVEFNDEDTARRVLILAGDTRRRTV